MSKRVSSKADRAKAMEKSRRPKRHNIEGQALKAAIKLGADLAPVSAAQVPVLNDGEIHCPVCGYGCIQAPWDETLYLHPRRFYPCRARDAVSA